MAAVRVDLEAARARTARGGIPASATQRACAYPQGVSRIEARYRRAGRATPEASLTIRGRRDCADGPPVRASAARGTAAGARGPSAVAATSSRPSPIDLVAVDRSLAPRLCPPRAASARADRERLENKDLARRAEAAVERSTDRKG